MKKIFITSSFIILLLFFDSPFVKSDITVACNFTVNGSSLASGYKFWKTPPIPSNYYSVNLNISGFSGNYAIYIANSSGIIAQVDGNLNTTSYTFNFAVPTSSGSYPNGGGYRFRVTAQGVPTNIWCESNQFYISSLPTLTMNLNTTPPLIVNNNATVSWSVSGGIPGLSYGGWTGNIRLQWYQNSTALTNLVEVPVSNNSYTFTVPSSIPGGTIPGSNFRIAGANANSGTSIPGGYVSAFTSYFSINYQTPNPPTLTYPPNGSTTNDLTPDLSWNAVSGGVGYWGQVSTNSSFSNIVQENSNIQALSWTPNLTQYTTYYWRIRTNGQGGTQSSWSSIWSFTVANTPSLIYPSSGLTVSSSTINFQWSDCNALNYELLVDNNSGFGSPEISRIHLTQLINYQGTSFQISGNWLEENVYYWKVTAVYSGGLRVTSQTGSFTYSPTKTTTPTWVPVYRTYNPIDVDHFYCTSDSHLVIALNQGYDFEKVDGYLSITPFMSTSLKSIFRFNIKNQKSHIYTTNPSTKDSLISADTLNNIYEGITGYAYGTPDTGLVKLYYAFLNNGNNYSSDHFYTISDIERNNAILNKGYQDHGFIAYVSPFGNEDTEPWMEMQPEIGYGVNPKNGNVGVYNKTSFNIPGANTSLSFIHIYNSYSTRLMSQVNPLGAGWSHTYMSTLSTYGGRIYVIMPGGGVHLYNQSDLKPKTKGVYDELSKISATKYQIKKKDQFVYTFDMLNTSKDSTAFLTSIKDRNNNTITCNYDAVTRRLTSVTSDGRSLTFYYYPNSELIERVVDPSGRTIKFHYDNDNNLIKFTDAKNQITNYEYYPDLIYDHLLKKVTYPKGNFIENVFLNKRLITQKISSTSQNLNFGYNSNTNTATITDQLSNIINVEYTAQKEGLIKSLITPSGTSTFEYNDNSNPVKPTKITDGNGNITTISYDLKGNSLQINKPLGIVNKFTYNSFNDVTQYTDPRNKITTYIYNPTGNLTSLQTPRGITQFTINSNGTINTITDPLSRVTTFTYNIYGNILTSKNNMNHTTTYGYNNNISRLSSMTDANSVTTDYVYDNNDLLLSETKPNSIVKSYTYDANDNIYNITNPNNQTTTFEHNDRDLLQSIRNPLSQQRSFQYFENGNLKMKTHPDGQSESYTYDNSNRLIAVSGAITGSIGYDNADNVTSVNDASGSGNNTYDALNRLTSHTHNGSTVSYGYDLSGNIISITYPGNKTVQYTYYDDNLLQTVKDWNNNTTSYTYRADGSVQEINYPNGTKKTYTYDAAGRVIAISNKKSNGSIICEYTFTLDNLGNHLSVSQTEPYSPIPLNSISRNFIYNATNRVTSEGGNSYAYTQNGNLLQKLGNDTINYGFDAENRLTNMSGKYEAGFTYDLYGNRRYSNISGNIKKYILDINTQLPKVLMETDNNGVVLNYYIYGNELISRIKPDGTTHYYHSDFRGSIIAMTNSTQIITHRYSYGAFGEIIKKSEPDANPFQYVGAYGVMNDGVGLYFMRARYYDPNLGRFISEDPVWDVNLYTYGGNNAISNIDPDGKIPAALSYFILKTVTNVEYQKKFFKLTGIDEKLGNWVYKKWFSNVSDYEKNDKKMANIQKYLYALSYSIQYTVEIASLKNSGSDLNELASLKDVSQLLLLGKSLLFSASSTKFIYNIGLDISKLFNK